MEMEGWRWWLARRATALTVSELARKLGYRQAANITMTVQRYHQRLPKDRAERELAARVAKMLNVSI